MLCFAANSLLCRLALAPRHIDAATFTTLRVASAAAMLSLIVLLQRRKLPRLARANPLSAAALFGYLIFFSFAYLRLDAGTGALILIGAVQLSMFGVAFYEGERFTAWQWTGLAMAIVGFLYLFLPGASAPDGLGAVFMAISGVAWGCFSLLARGVHDPVEANASTMVACLLPTLAINLLARTNSQQRWAECSWPLPRGHSPRALVTSSGILRCVICQRRARRPFSCRCPRLWLWAAQGFWPSPSPCECSPPRPCCSEVSPLCWGGTAKQRAHDRCGATLPVPKLA